MKVVCTSKDSWMVNIQGVPCIIKGPKYNETVTVMGVSVATEGYLCYQLLEYPNDINGEGWEACVFKPIDEIKEKIKKEESCSMSV